MSTVAFTGYRPEKMPFSCVPEDPRYQRVRHQLRRIIVRLVEIGADRFVSGMARGFDLWAAEEVLALRNECGKPIALFCAIPCPDQDKRYLPEERALYRRILREADQMDVISSFYHKDVYFQRNRFMVDMADTVVACYDGKSGGTDYTVRYAKSHQKGLILLDPTTAAVSAEGVGKDI